MSTAYEDDTTVPLLDEVITESPTVAETLHIALWLRTVEGITPFFQLIDAYDGLPSSAY